MVNPLIERQPVFRLGSVPLTHGASTGSRQRQKGAATSQKRQITENTESFHGDKYTNGTDFDFY